MQAIKVLPKGQITLPKNIRKRLKIAVGDPLLLDEKDGEIILKKTRTIFDYAGFLPDIGISIEDIIEKANTEAANENK
jgi:AbrB family looped-hinge helix DNA binding protein